MLVKSKIIITKIDDNWIDGLYQGKFFQAKFFEVGSVFGINEGRTSKLVICSGPKWDHSQVLFNYDRGYDNFPGMDKKLGHELAQALEQLPQVITEQVYTVSL